MKSSTTGGTISSDDGWSVVVEKHEDGRSSAGTTYGILKEVVDLANRTAFIFADSNEVLVSVVDPRGVPRWDLFVGGKWRAVMRGVTGE